MYQDLFGIWHDDDDYTGLNDVPEESAPTEAALLIASQRIALEGKACLGLLNSRLRPDQRQDRRS